MSRALADLRIDIDALDLQILTLLNQRAMVAEEVGEVKKREGTPFFRPDRVASVIARIQGLNKGPLRDQHIAAVWNEIMSACLSLESPIRVLTLARQALLANRLRCNFSAAALGTFPAPASTKYSELPHPAAPALA